MAMFLDDSSEDETCYLQLAERLRINRSEPVPHNNHIMNEKDLKDLSNHHKQKHHEEISSSSSLDIVDWSAAGLESANGHKNKKRQNGDKSFDQLAKPKRTCLGNILQRSPNWIDRKATKNSKMLNGPSTSSSSSSRNLYPDKTYEDHLINMSDDSDFEPTRRTVRNRSHGLSGSSKTFKSNGFQSSNKGSNLYPKRPPGNHSVQFIDSTSEDDSENVINHGALKGGRQSPESSSFEQTNRRVKKILDSDDSDKEDWQVSYRSRPLIFSSSDSDDSRPGEKTFIKTEKKPRKPANLSSSSESLPESRLHASCNQNGETGPASFRNDDQYPFSIPSSKSSFKKDSYSLYPNTDFHSVNAIRKLPSGNNTSRYNYAHENRIFTPNQRDVNLSKGIGISRSKSLRGGNHYSNLIKPSKSGDSHLRPSTSNHEPPLCNGSSSNTPDSTFDALPAMHQLIHTKPPYQNVKRNHSRGQSRTFPRTGRGSGRIRSRQGKFNLAAKYPDLFDAEDSSEVEFFTANSYSDNESNTESLNNARLTNPFRSPGHPRNKSNITTTGNAGSSEDEISVVFSGPPSRSSESRRGARTMGRARGRVPRRRLPSVQDTSQSPDPVAQVRQLEEDERFARILQAQFDAEVDPTFVPRRHVSPNPCHINIREEITSDSDDESSMDVHVDLDALWGANRTTSAYIGTRPWETLAMLNGPPVYRSFSRRGRRRSLPNSSSFGLSVDEISRLFHPFDDFLYHDSSDDYLDIDYEAFAGLGDVMRGLQNSEIDRLPTRKFRTCNNESSASGGSVLHKRSELNKECQVCLNDYVNGDVLRILPCFHEFHTPCIDPWLKINHTCPVCRVNVDIGE